MRIAIHFNFSVEINGQKAFSKPSWSRLVKLVKKRDACLCHYCGKYTESGHIDHVIPLSRGGTDSLENLAWACQECNLSKNDSTVEEWEERKNKDTLKSQRDEILRDDVVALWNKSNRPSVTGITKEIFGQTGGANWEKVKMILLSEGLLVQTKEGH